MLTLRLGKLLNSPAGKIMISILLGLGLASLFRKVCDDYNCVVYKGTPNDDVKNKVFKFDDKCYKYDITPITCDQSKEHFSF